jgi:hypothetical protein
MPSEVRAVPRTLDFYTQPAVMTSAGDYAHLFDGLPRDIPGLAAVAQGLLIHEHLVEAYGVTLSDERQRNVHIRPVERILERLMAEDDRPLTTARSPEARLPGNCRQFTVLTVAMLRAQGVPARARCGFGGYFGPDSFEDHWVCEYWHAGNGRWILADAQVDDVQKGFFPIDFNLMDVPRDRFVIAGDAWTQCRAGKADPAKFGLSIISESGLWFIASNLLRDAAALYNMEMLPWDDWGAMPAPDESIEDEKLEFFDHLAALTLAPDDSFDELRERFAEDDRLRVPPTVYNAVLKREEAV